MSNVIRAVYEKGVLKPLERVRLDERQVCLVSIYPEDQWREAFDALLKRTHKRTHKRTQRVTSQEIEADITAARSEVRAKRHATRLFAKPR